MSSRIIVQGPWYDNGRLLKDPKPRQEWDEVTEWEEANLCNKITIFDLPLKCPFPLTNRRNACALIENFIDAITYHRQLFPYWQRRAIKYFIWREMFVIRNNDEWKDYRNHPLYKNRDVLRRLAKQEFSNAMGLASALLFVLHGLYTNDWELEFLLKGQQKLIDTYNMCDYNMRLWNRDKMLDILFIECEWLKDTLLEAHMKEKKEMDEEWEHRQTKTLEEMEVFIEELPEPTDEDEEEDEEEDEDGNEDDENAQDNAQGNAHDNAQDNAQDNALNIALNNAQNNAQCIDIWGNDIPMAMILGVPQQWSNVVPLAAPTPLEIQTMALEREKLRQRREKALQQWDAQCYAQGLSESLVQSIAQICGFESKDAQFVARPRARYIAQRRIQDFYKREALSIVQERHKQRNRRQALIYGQIRAHRRAQGRTRGRIPGPEDEAQDVAQNNTQRIVQYFDRDTLQNTIRNLPPGNTEDSVLAFMNGVYKELVQGMAQDKVQRQRTQRRARRARRGARRTVQKTVRETTQNVTKENGQKRTQTSLPDFTATAPHRQRTDSQAPEKLVNTAVPPIDPSPTLPSRPVDDDEDIYGYSGDEDGNTKEK
ncbi:hypothetical protein FCIRC_12108 [Fusarium circinatum]|uniref:Uncharacterized protein n=1 Tax=Fusarium circinatum TaxID=48490 RepID=A0A8H5T0K1_FUSCI|nr:hypothetical protein FCIRC_12108 [Fusarium circinatum]